MKTKFLFIFFLAFSVNHFFAQSRDGKYMYQNDKGMTCNVTISEGGWKAAVVLNLGKEFNGRVIKARGEWFKVNRNGADPGYDGPDGWYQLSDGNCSMEFDEIAKVILLKVFDCGKYGVKNMDLKFNLIK